MGRNEIVGAYILPIGVTLAVIAVSYSIGDESRTMLQKALVAPLFPLGAKGLRAYFPAELDRVRSYAQQAEYQLLNSSIVSAFVVAMGPFATRGIPLALTTFVVMALFMAAWNFAFFVYGRTRDRNGP